jgi:DNA-binding MarR family transcriptional regulator
VSSKSLSSVGAGANTAEHASELATQLRAVLKMLRRRMREQGAPGDLTPSQIAVLLRLEKYGPATVSSLARAEGVRPQSMSATVTSLLDTGLVVGGADPEDGRKTLMSLSKSCAKQLQDGRAARQDWLANEIASKLSEREQLQIAAAVKLLGRLTEETNSFI